MRKSADTNLLKLLYVPISVAIITLIVIGISLGTMPVVKPDNTPQPTEEPVDIKVVITGSHEPGYYPEGFDFSLECSDENAKIYYTITSPSRRSTSPDEKVAPTGEVYLYAGGKLPHPSKVDEEGVRQSILYTKPIAIPSQSESAIESSRMTVIIAAAFDGDVRVSDYYYYTFTIDGKGQEPNYQDKFGSYLVSIIIDEEDLYDYERGIMIQGKAFQDERTRNPRREIDGWFPRNYNQRGREWERPCRIQIFDREGKLIIDQNVGVRIAGGMSRHNSIKSLRIISRSVYDEQHDSFAYEFFDAAYDVHGNKIKEFERIILRNSANDFGQTMFKDAFLHKLGGMAGVDFQDSAPCVVYINGKYYSLMNMRESIDADYIEAHYKIPKDHVTMVSIASGTGFTFSYKLTDGPEEGLDEFRKDMRKLISTDFSKRDISEIEAIIDVDNFIKYMAYQMYIANNDWPHNNVLAWKYTGPTNNSVYGMDGKWRFILKDLDIQAAFTSPHHNSYEAVLNSGMSFNEPAIGQVFRSCVRNKEFVSRFKEYMRKLCTEILTKEAVNNLLDKFMYERMKDMQQFWGYYGGEMRSWESLINTYRDFVEPRNRFMLQHLNSYF